MSTVFVVVFRKALLRATGGVKEYTFGEVVGQTERSNIFMVRLDCSFRFSRRTSYCFLRDYSY